MRALLIPLLFLLTALPAMAGNSTAHEARSNLTILADESLMLPLAQLSRSYVAIQNTPITVVVKDPATLEQQIEEGLEAHVVISANTPLLSQITQRGLTDVTSRRTVARTGLALVTTRERQKTLGIAKRISFASVLRATGDTPILTADAETLEGARAMALTHGLPFSDALRARLTPLSHEEEVLTTLRDEQALGLMLATQTVDEPDIAVISLLPEEISPAVNFDAVVLGGDLSEEANRFIDFLLSPPAEKIFTRFGYQTGR